MFYRYKQITFKKVHLIFLSHWWQNSVDAANIWVLFNHFLIYIHDTGVTTTESLQLTRLEYSQSQRWKMFDDTDWFITFKWTE